MGIGAQLLLTFGFVFIIIELIALLHIHESVRSIQSRVSMIYFYCKDLHRELLKEKEDNEHGKD